ncbi:MAG: response regulator [Bacillota bacterium]|nr:response regulator [Bacillota bacterium]
MKKVLVVDDTKNIRMLLTTCLELNGYEVVTANNGPQALDIFKQDSFDLAFLDIKLPEMSGTEVLRRIREMNIHIPVIIMTAFATVKNAVECTRLGAVAYLQKPFTADKVKSVLSEVSLNNANTCNSVDDYLCNATSLIEAGDLDKAFSLLKNALSINPSCGKVYELIGKIHEARNKIDEANKFYRVSKQFD